MMLALHTFFRRYAAAFVAGDVQQLAALYDYPLYIRHNDESHFFDKSMFIDNLQVLCSYYKDKNIQRFVFDVRWVMSLGTSWVVALTWHGFTSDATALDPFECCYCVGQTEGSSLKIYAVMNVNERIDTH